MAGALAVGREDLILIIKCAVFSKPTIITANKLEKECQAEFQGKLSLRQLGFQTFIDFLKSIPSVVQLKPENGYNPEVHPVLSQASKHIDQLVSKQKLQPPRKRGASPQPGRRRTALAPPPNSHRPNQLKPENGYNAEVHPVLSQASKYIDQMVSKQKVQPPRKISASPLPGSKRTSLAPPPTSHRLNQLKPEKQASKYIDQMVSKQKVQPPRKISASPLPGSKRTALAPPPTSHRLNQGCTYRDFEDHVNKNYDKKDPSTNGLHSANDLLSSAHSIVDRGGDRVYPRLSDLCDEGSLGKRTSTILQHLKSTFGEISPLIYEHNKYFTYCKSTKEFGCILCDKVIQKGSPQRLEKHITSFCHIGKCCPRSKVTDALTHTFKNKIPQIVKINILALDVTEKGYECVICNKVIQVNQDPKLSVHRFCYHLTSLGHRKRIKEYNERLDKLRDFYGEIPLEVKNNKDFLKLSRCGKQYECTLCNVHLKVYNNSQEQTEDIFIRHCQTPHHFWGAKIKKVISLIPELQHAKILVHSYLIRNIDYISNNGADFYCSLCHQNINYSHSANEIDENLKHHVLSSVHIENMLSRQTKGNVKLANLFQVCEIFTGKLLISLRYLQLNDGIVQCSICDEEFDAEYESDQMIVHLTSFLHRRNVCHEEARREDLIDSLTKLISEMPQFIEENLKYIDFVHGNNFCCTLCQVTVPWMNLENHFYGRRHTQALEGNNVSSSDSLDSYSSLRSLHDDFEDIFGEYYKDDMPACINDNWGYIEYDRNIGTFCCFLCKENIIVDEGTKREEITWQNLKMHFLSIEHNNALKQEAVKQMITSEKLESFFCGVPKCILNNVDVLVEIDDDTFHCDLCDVVIKLASSARKSAQNFLEHLRGALHRSNIEEIETSIDNAFIYIHKKFAVPECLFRNIDFWDNSQNYPDLYCTLCQMDLPVDLHDLKQTRWALECHVDSDQHKSNLQEL